jgi:curved DNA-binding protein CbpA
VKDYYSILGLDAEASAESIKVAYRRLATQYHPDRMAGASAEEMARSSDRMREINEAYAFLKDGKRPALDQPSDGDSRRSPVQSVPVPSRATEPVRPDLSVMFSSVAGELSGKVRSALSNSGMRWREQEWEGFNWAMVSGSLLSKYSVAMRGFPSVDLDVTRKFTNYAQLAIDRSSSYRRNFFVFLLAIQRTSRAEEVAAACRQFCYGSRQGKVAEIEIALLDVANAKTVLCGPKVRDERYGQLLRQLGFSMR